MKKLFSLFLASVILAGLLAAVPLPAQAAELPFTDVKPGDASYEDVKYVFEKGVMNGTSADRFSPTEKLTRAMLVTILYRMEGSPKSGAPGFTDVPAGAWYADSVGWAAANGVVNGVGGGKFAPNDSLTREQLVTIVYRYCKSPTACGDLTVFSDYKKISDWANAPLRWATNHGLISGLRNGTVAPKAAATRAVVAAMLRRMSETDVGTPTGLVLADEHKIVGNADFSALERLYAGTQATYVGLHEHSDSGKVSRDGQMIGSDGKFTLAQWKNEILPELGLDVVAIVDHRQVQHLYSPDWDDDLFIYGTEPGTRMSGLSPAATCNHFHYTMIFDDRDDLMNVLQHFTEFEFRGDSPDPRYWGFKAPNFTKERFLELVDYVHSIGGTVSHAHPRGTTTDYHAYLMSDNVEDYFIGEFTNFDTISWEGPYTKYSAENYEIWEKLLQAGRHVYASTIGDTHSVKRCDPSTAYTVTKKAPETFRQVRAGNFTAGYMGIKMNVGENAMGSVAGYQPGDTLTIEAADLFRKKPEVRPDGNYYLRVFTEKGLCACTKLDAEGVTRLALTVQDRAYYHADIFNADNGYSIAIGNPIWKN